MMYFETELCHHGIKGMKWGVRRFDIRKDVTLKKGYILRRVSNNKNDTVYDNKKYVSINRKDHDKWMEYLGKSYLYNLGEKTYSIKYKTTKDIKVMSSTKQGELYSKMLLDNEFKNKAIMDTQFANSRFRLKDSNDLSENISRNIALQTETGKAFVNAVMGKYDAIVDTHGTNVSDNPIIVFNPDKNLRKVGKTEYTKPVKEYLRQTKKR